MANQFFGSYRNNPKDHGFKGIARAVKQIKREEAERRNATTPHERTKQHRVRCSSKCPVPPVTGLTHPH